MTEAPQHEPVRWLEDPDATPALRSDLAHGASATASGIDYGATLTALRGAIAAQTAALPAAAASSSGWSMGVKLVLGVLVVGGIAIWAGRDDVARHEAPTTLAHAQLDPEDTSPRAGVVVPEAPASMRRPVAVQPTVAAEPTVDPLAEPAIVIPEDADAPHADAALDRTAKPKRRVEGTAPDRALPGADSPSTADSPSLDSDRYVREAKLVAQARRSLADDPSRALALTRQVEREFPNGLLEEERRALEIRALAALGKADEAKAAAKGFLAKFPDGPHAAGVRRAIED